MNPNPVDTQRRFDVMNVEWTVGRWMDVKATSCVCWKYEYRREVESPARSIGSYRI